MFLLDPDSKAPASPTTNFFSYLAGFSLALAAFDYTATFLRSYLLRPRFRLPYALREWSADDEFYIEDEKYINLTFKGGVIDHHADLPLTSEFKTREGQDDPIIGSWGFDRPLGN